MLAIPFEGSREIARPPGMTDEECSGLEIFFGFSPKAEKIPDNIQFFPKTDSHGVPFYVSYWMPSKEDLAAMNEGRGVWLKVCGMAHPPVNLFTLDENGDGNF